MDSENGYALPETLSLPATLCPSQQILGVGPMAGPGLWGQRVSITLKNINNLISKY